MYPRRHDKYPLECIDESLNDFNFNAHPECGDDEVFDTNLDSSRDFIEYTAKYPNDRFRKGIQAYDGKGKPYSGAYPVFRKKRAI